MTTQIANITIKEDTRLRILAKLLDKKPTELIEYIINNLVRYDILCDSMEYAGKQLGDIILATDNRTVFTCKMVLGSCRGRALYLFENLTIWGVDNDCPECGCSLNATPIYELSEIYNNKEELCGFMSVNCKNIECINH